MKPGAFAETAATSLIDPSRYSDFRVRQAILARQTPLRRIGSRLRDSIYSWLGADLPPDDDIADERLEAIRSHMLNAVQCAEDSVSHAHLRQKIYFAVDTTALWYLRADLMKVLSACHGERLARQQIAGLSSRFHGALPRGLKVRASPLDA
ncbi:MAG: hypothetical protein K2X51_03835 [Burkholderiales bacterium]|nr:hypothetical protein [Burkholderiales bacterium]